MTELEYYLVRQQERNTEMLSELEGVFNHLIFNEKAAEERANEAEERADNAEDRVQELLEDNAQGAAYIQFLKKRIEELGGKE